jgi:hypothetical protein
MVALQRDWTRSRSSLKSGDSLFYDRRKLFECLLLNVCTSKEACKGGEVGHGPLCCQCLKLGDGEIMSFLTDDHQGTGLYKEVAGRRIRQPHRRH